MSKSTDFDDGFYLTEYEQQAQKWATRECMIAQNKSWKNSLAVINIYSLDGEKVVK